MRWDETTKDISNDTLKFNTTQTCIYSLTQIARLNSFDGGIFCWIETGNQWKLDQEKHCQQSQEKAVVSSYAQCHHWSKWGVRVTLGWSDLGQTFGLVKDVYKNETSKNVNQTKTIMLNQGLVSELLCRRGFRVFFCKIENEFLNFY